jgi:hypothetical protein
MSRSSMEERYVELLYQQLNQAEEELDKLNTNWNGEDRSGILEDRIVHWEDAMADAEAEIEALKSELKEYGEEVDE